MSSDQEQALKTSNLARIRDNQRRSRARRKEYLSELENKYRACEQTGVEASAEIQAAARRVVAENRRLKQLLKEHGVSDSELEERTAEFGGPNGGSVSAVAGQLEGMLGVRRRCGSSGAGDGGCGGGGGESMGRGSVSRSVEGKRKTSVPEDIGLAKMQPVAPATRQGSFATESPQAAFFSHAGGTSHYPSPHSSSPSALSTPQIRPLQPQQQHQPQTQQQQLQQQQLISTPHQQQQRQQQMIPQQYPYYNLPLHQQQHQPHHQPHHQQPQSSYPYTPTPALFPEPQNLSNLPTWSDPNTFHPTTTQQPHHHHQQPSSYQDSTAPDITDAGSSSCYAAASAIRTYKADLGFELEEELGCGVGGRECLVPNSRVFSLMDRYSEGR